MPDIRHLIRIKSSPGKIPDAVTTARGFSSGWTTHVAEKPGQPNVLILKFGPDYNKERALISIWEGKSASWKCLVGDKEWVGTDIVFNLKVDSSETRPFLNKTVGNHILISSVNAAMIGRYC